MCELNTVLLGVDECEDVILGAIQYAFEDGQIRYSTACVEVFGAIEDNFVTFRSDLEIAVARIDGATDKLFENRSASNHWIDLVQVALTRFCSMSTFCTLLAWSSVPTTFAVVDHNR